MYSKLKEQLESKRYSFHYSHINITTALAGPLPALKLPVDASIVEFGSTVAIVVKLIPTLKRIKTEITL